MFGKVQKKKQDEKTRFYPRSAYGISKVAGFELTKNYKKLIIYLHARVYC